MDKKEFKLLSKNYFNDVFNVMDSLSFVCRSLCHGSQVAIHTCLVEKETEKNTQTITSMLKQVEADCERIEKAARALRTDAKVYIAKGEKLN